MYAYTRQYIWLLLKFCAPCKGGVAAFSLCLYNDNKESL